MRDTDLAVGDLALLAAFPPALGPPAFFDLDFVSLLGEAGVAKGAGDAVAEGVGPLLAIFALSLSAAFLFAGFFGFGGVAAAPSLDDSAAAFKSVEAAAAGFFFGFFGFVSAPPSVLGFVGFFGFAVIAFGVEPSAGMGEEAAAEFESSISILTAFDTVAGDGGSGGYACGVPAIFEGPAAESVDAGIGGILAAI